jgi:hypothetical protein
MIVFPVAADPVGAGLVDSLRDRARIGRFPEATTVTADGSQPLTHRDSQHLFGDGHVSSSHVSSNGGFFSERAR